VLDEPSGFLHRHRIQRPPPVAAIKALRVRAPARRNSALDLEKASSTGLRSGEQGDKNSSSQCALVGSGGGCLSTPLRAQLFPCADHLSVALDGLETHAKARASSTLDVPRSLASTIFLRKPSE
jgi:hypothetical protein